MTWESLRPLKLLAGWACIIGTGLITAFISLVAIASVWEGFRNIHRAGSWVPIVAGTLVLGLFVWVYVRGAMALYRRLNKDETLDL